MNIFKNKNLLQLKKGLILSVFLFGLCLTPLVVTGQVYAECAPGDTVCAEAACKAGENACIKNEPDPALTGDLDCNSDGAQDSGCNIVTKYVNPAIKLLSGLAVIACIIGIIYGAILYSASAGEPQKANSAKLHIRNSVIALILFFFLYAMLRFLLPGGTTG